MEGTMMYCVYAHIYCGIYDNMYVCIYIYTYIHIVGILFRVLGF